ncbi:MAG: M28 family peptidase, partial [Longimicrobiales bacterium]|nr:M28 family peptidase [Longimicrobiales bacterium]
MEGIGYRWLAGSAGSLLALGLVACAGAGTEDCAAPDPAQEELEGVLAHVRVLADDALEGRGVASRGERCAGEYIADWFESLGLEPAGEAGTYFQTFPVRTGSRIPAPATLQISPGPGEGGNPFAPDTADWRPYGFSGSGEVRAPLAWVGGVVPATLEGRVAVLGATPTEVPEGALEADPHYRATVALGRGAVGVIFLLGEGESLPDLANEDRPFVAAPVLAVAGEAAEAVRRAALEEGAAASLSVQVEPALSPARNVVARLAGADPARAGEVVVVGAHYDHLGWGGGSSLAPGVREIHNGADDNASGTAALLEVAAALTAGPRPERPVLFVAFSGEERGLL